MIVIRLRAKLRRHKLVTRHTCHGIENTLVLNPTAAQLPIHHIPALQGEGVNLSFGAHRLPIGYSGTAVLAVICKYSNRALAGLRLGRCIKSVFPDARTASERSKLLCCRTERMSQRR